MAKGSNNWLWYLAGGGLLYWWLSRPPADAVQGIGGNAHKYFLTLEGTDLPLELYMLLDRLNAPHKVDIQNKLIHINFDRIYRLQWFVRELANYNATTDSGKIRILSGYSIVPSEKMFKY